MSNPTNVSTTPGNGLAQLFEVLQGQAGDRGVRELLDGVHAALSARLEEQAAFREQQAKLQAELDEAKRTATEQQGLLERLRQENVRLTAERDQYLRSLYALLPKEQFITTDEELAAAMREGGVSFDEIRKMLEEVQRA